MRTMIGGTRYSRALNWCLQIRGSQSGLVNKWFRLNGISVKIISNTAVISVMYKEEMGVFVMDCCGF